MKTSLAREQKLVFADQSIAEAVFALLESERTLGDYSLSSKGRRIFEDTYFDTKERRLQRAHASLRLRAIEVGPSILQFKRPAGDPAVDMEYETFGCEYSSASQLDTIRLPDQIKRVLASQVGTTDLHKVGAVVTERRTLLVKKRGREVAEISLDRFKVSFDDRQTSLAGREIEIKSSDANEVLYLGQCLSNWFGLIRVTSSKIDRHMPLQLPASRLLLDMDPGVDDALALLYLFAQSNRPEIQGITTVGGNVDVMQCAKNTFRICRWAKEAGLIADIPPIATGIDLAKGRSNAANVHGSDGLGDCNWGSFDEEAKSRNYLDAVELQREVLLKYPGDVTVVVTGPCSNLAQLIERDPDVLAKAREIIIMGGSFFDCGNRGPQSEFNIHSDSRAARMVLEYCRGLASNAPGQFKERVPLSFVGLDVTHRAILDRHALQNVPGPIAELAAQISSKYMDFYRTVMGIDGCPLHDPLAVALALHPEYFVRERYHVEIISTPETPETDGITIADYRPCALFKDRQKEVTAVCVSVNAEACVRDFIGRLAKS